VLSRVLAERNVFSALLPSSVGFSLRDSKGAARAADSVGWVPPAAETDRFAQWDSSSYSHHKHHCGSR
jgi:hypothetical protein